MLEPFGDALAALTAWANFYSECTRWKEAGLDEETVCVEGHILILSTKGSINE